MNAALTERMGSVLQDDTKAGPRLYHWTVDKFYRAANAGVFDEPERLELIQGRIVENMPPSPQHVSRRVRAARRLRAVLEPLYYVVEEAPVHIAFDGEPIPDVLVLLGGEDDYAERHATPEDVVLLVEVAYSSADYDTTGKALLYALAGIADYWVVLPNENAIVIHRVPTPNGYGQITRLGEHDAVTPLAVSDGSLSVRDLLGLSGPEDANQP